MHCTSLSNRWPSYFSFTQLSELFVFFEEKPQGAASLAQVHKAVLHDGKIVAVKVQHPKVQNQSSKDIMVIEVGLSAHNFLLMPWHCTSVRDSSHCASTWFSVSHLIVNVSDVIFTAAEALKRGTHIKIIGLFLFWFSPFSTKDGKQPDYLICYKIIS